MLISLTVGKVDAGVAVLLTEDKRLIEFPSILLPPNIACGSIVDITVARNTTSESKSQAAFRQLQDDIYKAFGEHAPAAPVLRCRNATQTAVVLEWDPIELGTADIISLSLYRNGQKAGNIPRPTAMHSTKISGLAVDTEYTFHLVLRTTAGTFSSEKVVVRTHKMTDLTGITVTPGILPAQLRDSLTAAIERIGAKIADTVRIDTTHFVTTEGRGLAWEKAVEMNIPVVRPEWVEGCERGGRLINVRHYYLDADPRQRQMSVTANSVASPPPPAPTVHQKSESSLPKSPEPEQAKTNGDKTPTPEAPAEKSTNGTPEGEERGDDAKDVEEQKMRVEDREQQKVALRPGDAKPNKTAEQGNAGSEGEGESQGEDEDEDGGEDKAQPEAGAETGGESHKEGTRTPGASSFQDVQL